MSTKWIVVLSCTTLMAACGQTPSAAPRQQGPVLDPLTLATAPAAASPGAPVAPPAAEPSPARALKDLFGADFRTVDSQRLPGDVVAGHWASGRVPAALGIPAVLVLAQATPGPQQEYPKPQDKVQLSGAVYVPGEQGDWLLKFKQIAFGEFGASETAPRRVDASRDAWLKVADDRLIWAVGTYDTLPGGHGIEGLELIGVDLGRGSLQYLGRIASGENNDGDCRDAATPGKQALCFEWRGRLSVVQGQGKGAWPDLVLVKTGTRYDVRQRKLLKVDDRTVVRFSPRQGAYRSGRP